MAQAQIIAAGIWVWGAALGAGPIQIATTNEYGGTMGIPRWKIAMSSRSPDTLWLVFAKRAGNFIKSADGGATWTATNPDALTIDGYLDFHVAMWGDDDDRLHLTYPAYSESLGYHILYRRISPPGETESDFSPPIALTARAEGVQRSAIAVQGSDVFVFTRSGTNPNENVRYFLSRDGGNTFPTSGYVDRIDKEVRFGATLWALAPVVAVWVRDYPSPGTNQYRYYRWNGTSFVRPADSLIAQDMDNRFFSIAVVQDRTFHLAYGSLSRGALVHRWKDEDGGTGSWQQDIVADLGGTTYYHIECYPHLIAHGADLYIAWSHLLSGTTSKTIYWAKWDRDARTWSPPTRLTASSNNCKQINAPRVVLPGATALPIVWTEGTADPYAIFFATIPASSQEDPTDRGDVDRKIASFEQGKIDAPRVLEECQKYEKGE